MGKVRDSAARELEEAQKLEAVLVMCCEQVAADQVIALMKKLGRLFRKA